MLDIRYETLDVWRGVDFRYKTLDIRWFGEWYWVLKMERLRWMLYVVYYGLINAQSKPFRSGSDWGLNGLWKGYERGLSRRRVGEGLRMGLCCGEVVLGWGMLFWIRKGRIQGLAGSGLMSNFWCLMSVLNQERKDFRMNRIGYSGK